MSWQQILQYHAVKARILDDLSSLAPNDAHAKCIDYLRRTVSEHEEVKIAVQVSHQWMASNFPASLRSWEQGFQERDTLRKICRNVEKDRDVLERKSRVVARNWPNWDWTVPQDRTPPFFSEKLLRALVDLSNLLPKDDDDWLEWALDSMADVATARLRRGGGRKTRHIEPADVRKVIKMANEPPSEDEEQQQQQQSDAGSRSIEQGRNGQPAEMERPSPVAPLPSSPPTPSLAPSLHPQGSGSLHLEPQGSESLNPRPQGSDSLFIQPQGSDSLRLPPLQAPGDSSSLLHETTMQLVEQVQSVERPPIDQQSTVAGLLRALANQALADAAAIRGAAHDTTAEADALARQQQSLDASRRIREFLRDESLPAHWFGAVERQPGYEG